MGNCNWFEMIVLRFLSYLYYDTFPPSTFALAFVKLVICFFVLSAFIKLNLICNNKQKDRVYKLIIYSSDMFYTKLFAN